MADDIKHALYLLPSFKTDPQHAKLDMGKEFNGAMNRLSWVK